MTASRNPRHKTEKEVDTRMRRSLKVFIMALALLALGVSAASASVAIKRQEIRDMAKNTLAKLYELQPQAQKQVQKAAGYAVFSNWGLKIFVTGGGQGKGMAVNNKTRQETFMKMREMSAGLGFGAKRYSAVFLFETQSALDQFTQDGWQFGGRATAAVTDGNAGGGYQGAVSVSEGVWMYEMTEKGLALELTLKGAKFSKSELN